MTREYILSEISRTAAANGGRPLGRLRFHSETGIKESDWHGKYWARWNDALSEAGFPGNQLQGRLDSEVLISALANLTNELGRFPVSGELRLRAKQDPGFPSHNTFAQRLGSKADRLSKVAEFCRGREGYEQVLAICESGLADVKASVDSESGDTSVGEVPDVGFVYLLKSGRHFKIGRSNATGRREYELRIQLPEKAGIVHEIRTDDPVGIEAYWHRRFEAKRKNGEWFALDAQDVKAFRRRKFM